MFILLDLWLRNIPDLNLVDIKQGHDAGACISDVSLRCGWPEAALNWCLLESFVDIAVDWWHKRLQACVDEKKKLFWKPMIFWAQVQSDCVDKWIFSLSLCNSNVQLIWQVFQSDYCLLIFCEKVFMNLDIVTCCHFCMQLFDVISHTSYFCYKLNIMKMFIHQIMVA